MNFQEPEQSYFGRYVVPAFREFVVDRAVTLLAGLLVLCAAGFALSCYLSQPLTNDTKAGPQAAAGSANRIFDGAHILTKAEESSLSNKLNRLEAETGHQLVVVTVVSLNGKNIAQFATELGNAKGIGREAYDDGVIVLVAPNERKIRIAVGRGLGRVLPDQLCDQIIQTSILPHFRTGNIYEGVNAGVERLIRALS